MHASKNIWASRACLAASASRTTGILVLLLLFIGGTSAMAAPEIGVEQGGNSVSDSGTVSFGTINVGSSSTKTFTIRNSGADTLLGLALQKSGANAADFTYTALSTGFLPPGGSTTFDVTFSPSQGLPRTAAIRISSNDANENPYDINLQGSGSGGGAPEISVTRGLTTLTDGASTVNFGNVRVGIVASRTLRIRNTGTGTLSGLSVSISSAGQFQAENLSVNSLGAGADIDFDVTFTPTGEFPSTASLQIFSNDANENPFDIDLQGAGVLPFMDVEQQPEGSLLTDEFSTIDFGTTDPGVPVQKTFTLRNVSTGALTGLALSKDGSHSGDFIPGSLSSTTLASGGTMDFTVSFNPNAPGDRTATIHLVSNESAANPFDISVKGVGTALSDLGDADGDGTVNMVEQATASDPLIAGPPPGVIAMNGNNLEFTFSKSVSHLFLVYYTVEWSDDLNTWNGVPEENATIVREDGTVQEVKYTLDAGPNGQRYMRLRVTKV